MNISSGVKRISKKVTFGEKIGFAMLFTGLVLMIANNRIDNVAFTEISQRYHLFYSGGLLIWAIGYFLRINKNKSKREIQS